VISIFRTVSIILPTRNDWYSANFDVILLAKVTAWLRRLAVRPILQHSRELCKLNLRSNKPRPHSYKFLFKNLPSNCEFHIGLHCLRNFRFRPLQRWAITIVSLFVVDLILPMCARLHPSRNFSQMMRKTQQILAMYTWLYSDFFLENNITRHQARNDRFKMNKLVHVFSGTLPTLEKCWGGSPLFTVHATSSSLSFFSSTLFTYKFLPTSPW